MMKKIAILLIVIILLQAAALYPAFASPYLQSIEAQAALLIETETGTILYEQDIHRRHPADSFAKIMTVLIAAQAVENDVISDHEIIEMTESAWHDINQNSTTQSISAGQFVTFIDLMYSAFVGSANEACNMIALRMAGTVEVFVRMMNEKAAELGCSDTNFVNPHGQYHENQYTTAYDMYIIYNAALKSDLFSEIAGTYRHITERTEDTESRTLVSSNSMLNQSGIYYYGYCLSGLSSSSYEGGFSLVASAEEEGLSLISVVLGARDIINADQSVNLQHFTESYRLFMWGYENYGWRDIVRTTDLLARVPVEHGSGADFVNVRPERALTLLLDSSVTTDAFVFDITIYSEKNNSSLIAPVSSGAVLGEVVISRDGVVLDKIDLIANTSIEIDPLEYTKQQISSALRTPLARFLIITLIIIVAVYIALIVRYNILRTKRLRRIKDTKEKLIREKRGE